MKNLQATLAGNKPRPAPGPTSQAHTSFFGGAR